MSFDPHGSRRNADNGNGAIAWSDAPITNHVPANTTRGFTGHEHIDAANIVHMNGRLYDPALGRMLSADPIVQELFNAQNLNRYTYVLNNPLSFTDPTGLSFISKYWRTIVAVVIAIYAPYLAPLLHISAFAAVVIGGFVSGVITSGSLRGGLMGAFSAAMFYGIGQHFDDLASINISDGVFGTGLNGGQFAAKVLAHGIAGGIMNRLQGGQFGHGFASAGVTQALSPAIGRVDKGNAGFSPTRVVVAAMVGGTASAASGGKFANGAVTAAFSRAFNDELHPTKEEGELSLKIEANVKGIIAAAVDENGLALSVKTGKLITIKMDNKGNFVATSGKLTAIGNYSRDKLGSGISIGAFSVNAIVDESGNIKLPGTAELPIKINIFGFKVTLAKTVNIRNASFESSGLIGTAARALQNTAKQYDDAERCAESGDGC